MNRFIDAHLILYLQNGTAFKGFTTFYQKLLTQITFEGRRALGLTPIRLTTLKTWVYWSKFNTVKPGRWPITK